MSEITMSYRALCIHGKVRAMVVDDSLSSQHCLKDVREFKRWAHRLDHVTVEEARKSDMDCPECDEIRRAKRRRNLI